MKVERTLTLLITCFLLTLFSERAKCQNIWLNDTSNFFAFEFVTPSLKSGFGDVSVLSGAYNFSCGKYLSHNKQLLIVAPITYIKGDNFDSEAALGNVYIGLKMGSKSNLLNGEFGLILPTMTDDRDDAQFIGALSDWNRVEAYADHVFGLTAKIKLENNINTDGLYYRARGGFLYLRDTEFDDNLWYFDISAQLGYRTVDNLNFLLGLSRRSGLSENTEFETNQNSQDRSVMFFGISASYRTKNLEPGLSLRIPLDEPMTEYINNSIGISLLFHF